TVATEPRLERTGVRGLTRVVCNDAVRGSPGLRAGFESGVLQQRRRCRCRRRPAGGVELDVEKRGQLDDRAGTADLTVVKVVEAYAGQPDRDAVCLVPSASEVNRALELLNQFRSDAHELRLELARRRDVVVTPGDAVRTDDFRDEAVRRDNGL